MNNDDRSAQAVPAVGSRLDRLVRRLPRPVQHVYWAVHHGEWDVGWGYVTTVENCVVDEATVARWAATKP